MTISLTKTETALRLWTVSEYHRMAEVGILQPDDRVELVAGQILRKMSPQKTPHAAAITRCIRIFSQRFGDAVLVRSQLPVTLNTYSEPEPDIAIVRRDPRDYLDAHPTPTDVYLIVEISDTTLERDRGIKATEYGRSGIAEYWVLDVKNRQLHVFRQPGDRGYEQQAIVPETESISPVKLGDDRVSVRDILPPI